MRINKYPDLANGHCSLKFDWLVRLLQASVPELADMNVSNMLGGLQKAYKQSPRLQSLCFDSQWIDS